MKNKILINVILIFLVLSIFSISIINAAEPSTTPSTGGAATGTGAGATPAAGAAAGTGTVPSTEPVSAPADKTEKVGDKLIPGAKSEAATIQGGTVTPAKDGKGGGEFIAGGKGNVGGKETSLGDKGSIDIDTAKKDTSVKDSASGSKVSVNPDGSVKELDVKGVKPKDGKGTIVKISGEHDTEVKVPEGGEMKKEKAPIPTGGKDATLKSDIYTTELGDGKDSKEKVLDKPTRKERKKEEQEGADPYFRFNGMNYALTDAMAEQFGMPKGSKFSGSLTMDPQGNWFYDKTTKFTDSAGNQIFRSVDMSGKYGNVNDRTYLFNKNDWNGNAGKAWRENMGGSYIVPDAASKNIVAGSTNDKIGPYVELGDKNPFNGYKSAIMPEGNSKIEIQGTNGAPQVKIDGNGIFYGGEGVGFLKKGDNLLFKQGAKIEQIFGVANVAEFGLKFDRSPGYKTDVYSLQNDGSAITTAGKNLYVKSTISSSGAITNEAFPLDNKGVPVANSGDTRVSGNPEEPKGKGAKTFLEGLKDLKKIIPGLGGGNPAGCTPGTPGCPPTTGNPVPDQKKPTISPEAQDLLRRINPPSTNHELYETLGSYSGKGIVVIASSTSCGPCIKLHNQLKANLPPGVEIRTFDVNNNPELLRKWGISGYPTAVKIDPNTGKVLGKVTGLQEAFNFINGMR